MERFCVQSTQEGGDSAMSCRFAGDMSARVGATNGEVICAFIDVSVTPICTSVLRALRHVTRHLTYASTPYSIHHYATRNLP